MDVSSCRLLIHRLKLHRFIQSLHSRNLTTPHHVKSLKSSNIKDIPSTDTVQEEKTRNIGILAHIDAGKTTTTERMLYSSGLTRYCGNVDSGDTVMDYLPQERERGITINSATITFPWKGYRINLIDTPGHVDFTVEVERTLLALDAVVIILDAAKGVEAQTQTVWRQATRFGLPSIIYLNKMDKPNANVPRCLEQLKSKLGLLPLPLQLPVGTGKSFSGVVDVLYQKMLGKDKNFMDTKTADSSTDAKSTFSLDTKTSESLKQSRQLILERLAEVDDDFAELYLNQPDTLDNATIESEIREACLKRQLSPLLMGSSLRNYGVPALLDAVTKYFPNPLELHKPVVSERLANSSGFYALAFKNVHEKQKGLLTFLRIYRGTLKPNSTIYNVNKHQREKVSKIMEAYADELREISEAKEGNIAVISGLKETITGDTLVAVSSQPGGLFNDEVATDQVPILRLPDPVYFCAVEAESPSKQLQLEEVLGIIQKEDPSVKVRTDPETGQLILAGMGELHLEIIRDRIKSEYNLDAYLGPLQVAYKETITKSAEKQFHLTREVQGTYQRVDVHLRLIPAVDSGAFRRVKLVNSVNVDWTRVDKEWVQAVNNGVAAGLSSGVLRGCPVIDVQVELLKISTARGTLPSLISAAASQCIRDTLRETDCQLLQPLMTIGISLPSETVHDVLADLAKRHAQIKEIDVVDETARTITAECPLAEMMHFTRDIRTVSHGLANISMELGRYVAVDGDQLDAMMKRRGF